MNELDFIQNLTLYIQNNNIILTLAENNKILGEKLLDMCTPTGVHSTPQAHGGPGKSQWQLEAPITVRKSYNKTINETKEEKKTRSTRYTGFHTPVVREFVNQVTDGTPFTRQDIIAWAREHKKIMLDALLVSGSLGYLASKKHLIANRSDQFGKGRWVKLDVAPKAMEAGT